jgi:fermentation-respiration switch protein FrsA (DUF1100 family)
MLQAIRRRRWLKVVLGLLGLVLMMMLLTTAATQVLSYWAVHPPREQIARTPASLGLPYEDVAFTTQDGLLLRGWFLPAASNHATVILGHGFTRSRQELLDVAAMLHRNCYNVLMFDWRAHGESEGTRTTFGYKEVKDLAAAVDYVASRPELDPQRIGVLGKSMGGAIAIRAAAELPQIQAVVSDSPYPSLQDSIQVGVERRGPLGVWPFRFIALSLGLNAIGIDPGLVRPIDDIDEISPRPVLIIQGGRDALVPADTGERLYAAAGEPKYLWYAPEAAHVEASSRYPREYEARVIKFFDAALGVPRVAACRPALINPPPLFRGHRVLLPR